MIGVSHTPSFSMLLKKEKRPAENAERLEIRFIPFGSNGVKAF